MRKLITIASLAIMLVAGAAHANPEIITTPKVEVVFVLDTTGSMSGLIEGAKQKIWWIANQIIKGTPTPEIEVGLVAYRDHGDDYVTRVTDLNGDLDAVYRELMSFNADGGGDTPEHVNKALHDAVHEISWSDDIETLKIVFLVGDAPPHVDYDDGFDYETVCMDAVIDNIVINAVQCGDMFETAGYWDEIARLGEGEYTSVEQSGGMRMIPTPMDDELAALSDELHDTVVFWGEEEEREYAAAGMGELAKLDAPMAAERAAYKASSGRMSDRDLIDAVSAGDVSLGDLEPDMLPDELEGMSEDEIREYVEEQEAKRGVIEEKIADLSRERDAYIADKLADAGADDSFDAQVLKMIRAQAAAKGIAY